MEGQKLKKAIEEIKDLQIPLMRSDDPLDQAQFSGLGRAYNVLEDILNESDPETDNVNHPAHYEQSTSIECIEAMELVFDRFDVQTFCLCNAFKYIWRHKNKGGLEDLEKAQWYIEYAKNLYLKMKISDKDLWTDHIESLQNLLDQKKRQWQESH